MVASFYYQTTCKPGSVESDHLSSSDKRNRAVLTIGVTGHSVANLLAASRVYHLAMSP